MDAFGQCLPVILREEGGYVNDRLDPGGMTNLGVTQRSWSQWIGRPATEADMRALTPTVVAPFYRAQYWQAAACDSLPVALALCVFDFSVNGGVGRAVRYLQQMVNVDQDGHCGPATLRSLQQFVGNHPDGIKTAIFRYSGAREQFYRDNPNFDRFGKGWLDRVAYVENCANALV